eukprot:CAMPEP_0197836690 /NCGR_PEP_ID=MMETSP1437-20131217/29737_1 /TAXON_ID=49252 ORGANISM="Eucampia antarctica, Strain CCMP1452" /NCGR_SAMPLE_ID=MMETSP1437 /ASSEMBLY_ACC=CAM_ASM_001096 /LENGTH=309 /DNA_ID=CAMNT_0043443069 /DNA_START=24 /DNA_END=953 /DNA_ORIENTATION=+
MRDNIPGPPPPPLSPLTVPQEPIVNNNNTPRRPYHRRVGGRTNYNGDELQSLYGIMEEVLPIDPDEWGLVLQRHSVNYPGRDVDSIRRKYHTMHRKKIPTGDPNMPDSVRAAKRIKYKIGDRAGLGGGAEGYDLEEDDYTGEGVLGPPVERGDNNNTGRGVARRGVETDESDRASQNARSPSSRLQPGGRNEAAQIDDFIEMMKLQMLQDAQERRESRRREEIERRQQEIDRQEKRDDRRSMERMFIMAISSFAAGWSGHNNKKRKRRPSNRCDDVTHYDRSDGSGSNTPTKKIDDSNDSDSDRKRLAD